MLKLFIELDPVCKDSVIDVTMNQMHQPDEIIYPFWEWISNFIHKFRLELFIEVDARCKNTVFNMALNQNNESAGLNYLSIPKLQRCNRWIWEWISNFIHKFRLQLFIEVDPRCKNTVFNMALNQNIESAGWNYWSIPKPQRLQFGNG